jgi:hypothetical protein
MGALGDKKTRKTFRWSQAARDAVRTNLNATGSQRRDLITKISHETGNPRSACLRFARKLGLKTKRPYRKWAQREQKELLASLDKFPVQKLAPKFGRNPAALYGMLRRLGATARMRKDSVTLYGLAELLHIRAHRVREWIDAGLLEARREGTERLPRLVIEFDEFARFCKRHRELLFKGRVTSGRLNFIFKFVYPEAHTDLLPVRESKKEQAEYEAHFGV